MSSIKTGIELQDGFTPVLENIISTTSEAISEMEQMQQAMSAGVDTSAVTDAANDINEAAQAAKELSEALQGISAPVINTDAVVAPARVEVPETRETPTPLLANPPPVETPQIAAEPVTVPVTAEIVEQPEVNVPEEVIVPVTPVVTEQPEVETPEPLTVPVTAEVEEQPVVDVPDGIDVPVTAEVTQQPVVDVPDSIEVPITPEVTQQPTIDVPDEISVPVDPVVTGQPEIDVPDEITVPVIPEVTQQPEIKTPDEIDVPVIPEVTQQPIISVPDEIVVPVDPVVTGQPEIETPKEIEVPVNPEVTQQPTIDTPDEITVPVNPEVTGQPVISAPKEIDVPVTPEVTQQPEIDVPDSITVPVDPVVTEQPTINVPDEVEVSVDPVVTRQPVIDVPSEIDVPITPEVTQQPIINTPDEITVPVNPEVTEQPVIDVPDSIDVSINPVVTEQPKIDIPEPDTAGMDQYQSLINLAADALQRVVDIQERINAQSESMGVLPADLQAKIAEVNSGIRQMQMEMNLIQQNPFDLGTDAVKAQIVSLNDSITRTLQSQQELDAALQSMSSSAHPVDIDIEPSVPEPLVEPEQPPVVVPVEWQGDFEVFTSSGVERFQQEVQGANAALETLNQTQQRIAQAASGMDVLPDNAQRDIASLSQRLQEVTQRVQTISNNPVNMGTDLANAGLEQIRSQLDQAISAQEELNAAIDSADPSRINSAYLQLSQTVRSTETYIRDNTTEQGEFNAAIQESTDSAESLKRMIAGAVAGFTGIAGIRKAFSFMEDCTEAFNTQLNAENQLMTVLGNMLDEDYVASFELDTSADVSGAVSDIAAIQDSVSEVEVPVSVSAKTQAIMAEFDKISEKASEIQSEGIYGDEAMIAAGAEFATYFSDTDAITTMMDTLSNYAMGMSGGGEIDSTAMVDYATGLGKIMTGSYDAMTKKGFEFSDAQKDVIDGVATQEELVAVLGENYQDLSDDMQAATVISQVINESWGSLYETMSDTPEGQIIQLKNAWGDMGETVGRDLYPYIILFIQAIENNWGTICSLVDGLTWALQMTLGFLSLLVDAAGDFARAVADNWGWISPIIYGVVTALGVYYAAQFAANVINLVSKGIHIAMAGAQLLHAAATGTLTAATAADIAAQNGLNASMAASPITWIIIMIIALIAILVALSSWIADVTGLANSGIGIIVGALSVAVAFIGNIFVALINAIIDIFVVLWNFIASFANFFGNVFTDPVNSIGRLFFDLVDSILSLLQTLASVIDTLFGSDLSSAVQGWRDDLSSWVDETYGQGDEIMEKLDSRELHVDSFDYGAAWEAGVELGDSISEGISSVMDGFLDPSSLFDAVELPTAEDYAWSIGDSLVDTGVAGDIGDISADTGDIADSMEITSEDLKYLRDIAEQEAINRYTTAEIRIEQTNNNNINSDMDLDGVVDGLTSAVNQAVDEIIEGAP